MSDPEPNPNPDNIRPVPIRHESLSDELLEQVRSIFEIVGPYLDTTLEQFEVTLMRDAAPEDEVVIWASITAAWLDYHKQHLDDELLPEVDEKKLLAGLIAISTGVEDVEALGVPVDVGRKLLACYDALGEELA
jgi:hypothetical protein